MSSEAWQMLVDCVGPADAAKLVGQLPGTLWRVNSLDDITATHPWVAVLGKTQASRLWRYMRGIKDVRIPRDRATLDALIDQAVQAGNDYNAVAVQFQIDYRSVYNAINRHRKRQAQQRYQAADLFSNT